MAASLPRKPKQQQTRAKHNGQYWAFKNLVLHCFISGVQYTVGHIAGVSLAQLLVICETLMRYNVGMYCMYHFTIIISKNTFSNNQELPEQELVFP